MFFSINKHFTNTHFTNTHFTDISVIKTHTYTYRPIYEQKNDLTIGVGMQF